MPSVYPLHGSHSYGSSSVSKHVEFVEEGVIIITSIMPFHNPDKRKDGGVWGHPASTLSRPEICHGGCLLYSSSPLLWVFTLL
jgi:hypothetical protein